MYMIDWRFFVDQDVEWMWVCRCLLIPSVLMYLHSGVSDINNAMQKKNIVRDCRLDVQTAGPWTATITSRLAFASCIQDCMLFCCHFAVSYHILSIYIYIIYIGSVDLSTAVFHRSLLWVSCGDPPHVYGHIACFACANLLQSNDLMNLMFIWGCWSHFCNLEPFLRMVIAITCKGLVGLWSPQHFPHRAVLSEAHGNHVQELHRNFKDDLQRLSKAGLPMNSTANHCGRPIIVLLAKCGGSAMHAI